MEGMVAAQGQLLLTFHDSLVADGTGGFWVRGSHARHLVYLLLGETLIWLQYADHLQKIDKPHEDILGLQSWVLARIGSQVQVDFD